MNNNKLKIKNYLKSLILNPKSYILLFIIILGAILRLQGIFTNSFAFTYDVGRDMLALWEIAVNHKILLIGPTTGVQGVFYGPWWYYILTPFFILFSGNPQGIALVMALSGILCIILAFYLGRKIGNTLLGVSMALFTAISPSLISSSSQIWNPNLAPLFVFLTLIILVKIYVLKSKIKLKYYLALGIILGLNMDMEILWGVLFFFGIIISMATVLRKQITLKRLGVMIAGIFLILSPRIIFELRHGFLMTKSFFAFLLTKTAEDKLDLYHFLENRINIHFNTFEFSVIANNNYLQIILFILILLATVLFYKKSSELLKVIIKITMIILVVFYIGTFIFSHAIWPHYLVGLPVLYVLLLSVAIYLSSEKLKGIYFGWLILLMIFVVMFKSFVGPQLFNNTGWEGDASLYRNQIAVIDYVYKESKGKSFKYVVYTPPVHDYTYRYLFKWYGYSKYKYVSNEDARLAYFILEPDPGYEDRLKWWLDARKNDGKIIKESKISGGIIIQTRTH